MDENKSFSDIIGPQGSSARRHAPFLNHLARVCALAANYRGITLMSCTAKLYDRILLNRLRGPLESILHKHQHGFRSGCGTAEPVLALRRAIEELSQHRNRGLVVVFVDFLKAFDSVSRDALFQLLPLYGIPAELIAAIRCLYDGSTSFVSTLDGNTEPFPVLTGILQGDPLAPLLFIHGLRGRRRPAQHQRQPS